MIQRLALFCGLAVIAFTSGPAVAQQPVDLTIFVDDESLTIFVPEQGLVSLRDLSFLVGADPRPISLSQYPALAVPDVNRIPTPVCFRLQRDGSQRVPPLECRSIPTLTESLPEGNLFWHDPAINQRRTLTIARADEPIIFCAAGQPRCEVSYVPPLPPPATIPAPATATLEATATATLEPTDPPEPTERRPTERPTAPPEPTDPPVEASLREVLLENGYDTMIDLADVAASQLEVDDILAEIDDDITLLVPEDAAFEALEEQGISVDELAEFWADWGDGPLFFYFIFDSIDLRLDPDAEISERNAEGFSFVFSGGGRSGTVSLDGQSASIEEIITTGTSVIVVVDEVLLPSDFWRFFEAFPSEFGEATGAAADDIIPDDSDSRDMGDAAEDDDDGAVSDSPTIVRTKPSPQPRATFPTAPAPIIIPGG